MTDFKEIFKNRKKLQILTTIVAAFTVMLLYITKFEIVALAIVIGIVVFTRFNWRCPKCNKYLGKGSNPKHCSNCGEELQ